MARRSFEMYEIRQIIVCLRSGETIRGIAQTKLANRKKIRAVRKIAVQQNWLDIKEEIPADEVLATFFKPIPSAKVTQSSVLPYSKQIEEWCQQGIQGTTIHAALKRQHGFEGSYDSVQRFVKKTKDNLPPAVTTILEFKPGECAQVDFGYGPKLVDEVTGKVTKTWIFVMVLGWSRHMYAELVLHQDVETWLGCHRRAFEFFNGVPKKIIIDNAKCAITKACYYDPVVQRAYADYAEGYGFMISACPPRDPQKKGRVESGVKYVKNNFVPLREFKSLANGNQQLIQWVLSEAGNRIHGTTRAKPLTLFTQTEALLLQPLPDNPPECAVWEKVKLHNDCHVMYLQCRYSAPYQLVQEILWLRATETTVRIYQEHTLVAVHPRLIVPGTKHTIDAHLPPNASAYAMQDAAWCLEQSGSIGIHCKQVITILLTDKVTDYLRAAQGILSLNKKYGSARLDAACHRALMFNSIHYKTIKSILKEGLEYQPFPTEHAFDALAETYTGQARFCRDTSTLLQ